MTDQTETFVQRILIDAKQSLDDLGELRGGIDAVKASILSVQNQSNESFPVIAETMRRSAKAMKDAALEQLQMKAPSGGMSVDEAKLKIEQQYRDTLKFITMALKEVNQEQRVAAQTAKQFGG